MGDIISFLLELNELKELRYELETNDRFFNVIEPKDNRWYANIKFYGNEKGHLYNADMCQFLASLNESHFRATSHFNEIPASGFSFCSLLLSDIKEPQPLDFSRNCGAYFNYLALITRLLNDCSNTT